MEALSSFDRDYPLILTKNGWLSLDNKKLLAMHCARLDLLIGNPITLAEKRDAPGGRLSFPKEAMFYN